MLKTLIKLIFTMALVFILSIPVREYFKKVQVQHAQDREEQKTIGSTSSANPRVMDIQSVLSDVGLYQGPIDGIMGTKTRNAISQFQEQHNFLATGKIEPKTWIELNKQSLAADRTKNTRKTAAENKPRSIQLPKNAALTKASTDKKANDIQDQILHHRLDSRERLKQVQAALQQAGFYQGTIDGKMGIQTRQAIKGFQLSKKLKADGIIGPKTLRELGSYMRTEPED